MTIVERSFLVSFMVDARGGAMRGTRHSGIRIVIPPGKASMPTRILCRLIKKEKLLHPPVVNEGEALANRIIEMGPHGTKFLGPVLIEVPHFASLREKEREITVMRSDNGETWYEHPMVATEDAVASAMAGTFEEFEGEDDLAAKRITRILTTDLPQYFAIVTRVRIENQMIGDEGGVISSKVVPQVQAVFPQGALNKRIKVGLQAQPIAPEIITKLCGNRVACSPIVTVEPRRRKFHKPITLTIPVPKTAQKGMINQYPNENPTLRLLCSITGGANQAVWEDITENKNLQFTNDCVSFTTTVSARFWLMDCQATTESASMATEIYHEAVNVPYMARFVVFAKRTSIEEGQLRMFCMTDDRTDKTLEKQQNFTEVARSRDVEVLEGRPQFVEMAGNLIPVTKSGDQLFIDFKAFRENRLPCTVRIRDLDQEQAARVAFMKEPKVARGELPQIPICNLNITLPGWSKSSSMELDADASLEVRKRHSLLREHGIVLEDSISRAQVKLTDVADTLQGDWVILAQQLDITGAEINNIKSNYNTVNDQALAMLQLWVVKKGPEATGNALENGLRQVGREDVIKKSMYNVEEVVDELEAAAARATMDQSGFDNFAEEVGIDSREASLRKGMSLDVQYDEEDMLKESESANEDTGSISSEGEKKYSLEATKATAEGDNLSISDDIIAEIDERRRVAQESEEPLELSDKKKEAYLDLIMQLDRLEDERESRYAQNKQEELDDTGSVGEDAIVEEKKKTEESALFRIEALGVEAELKRAPEVPSTEPEVEREPEVPSTEPELERVPSPEPQLNKESTKQETSIDQLAARLAEPVEEAEDKLEGESVFDAHLQGGELYYEHKNPDGSLLKTHRIKHLPRGHVSFDQTENVELYEIEGPVRQEVDVQDDEEILADGTIHKTHHVRHHSLRHILKSLRSDAGEEDIIEDEDIEVPGTSKERVVETFEEPPKKVFQEEDEEETLEDGTIVKRHIKLTSMTQKIRTRQKSIDEGGHEVEFEEEIDEVVPGTQSCFIYRSDSSSSSSSFIDDLDEMEADIIEEDETLDDGTIIQTTFLEAREKRRSRSRSGSLDTSEDVITITEKRVTPAPSPAPSPTHSPCTTPRSGSPTNIEDFAAQIAQKTLHTAHFELTTHKKDDEIESTLDFKTEDTIPPNRAVKGGVMDEEPEGEADKGGVMDDEEPEGEAESVSKYEHREKSPGMSSYSTYYSSFSEDMDDTASITSSEQAMMQTPDQSEGNTNSAFSSDFCESDAPPPQPLKLEELAAEERKRQMISSYENVYTDVPLEPTVNRMSMDASEIDIGDRFDTKQTDSKFQTPGLSSSYEQLYEKSEQQSDNEGECKSESATLSPGSGLFDVCSISFTPSSVRPSHSTDGHTCPVHITVESGLDKLACSSSPPAHVQGFSAYDGHSIAVRSEVVERSMSCDSDQIDETGHQVVRTSSSPNVYSPVETRVILTPFGKGGEGARSSSSEVAQQDDLEVKQATIKDKTAGTDVEEEFFHFTKHTPALKQTFELDVKDQTEDQTFSITDSPTESVSGTKEPTDISPIQENLKLENMSVSVGRSPSDFLFELDESQMVKAHMKLSETVEESDDSLFDDESKTGNFKQVEKIVSKESHREERTTTTSTSVEESLISKEEVDGEPARIVMEEKKFSTEDVEKFSKKTKSQDELKLSTSETITEDIEMRDDGSEIRKERKDLVATIDKDSNVKTEETLTKSLTKKEDMTETVYPFVTETEPGKITEKLVDTVSSKKETLQTTLNIVTDENKHTSDETKLKSERQIEVQGSAERIIDGSEIETEEQKHLVEESSKEEGNTEVNISKKEEILEVLFDVNANRPDEMPVIGSSQERHGQREEQFTERQEFKSIEKKKEGASFDINSDTAKEMSDSKTKVDTSKKKQQRDSGLFEETSSEEDSEDETSERSEQLEVLAFDNMAFSEEEIVKAKAIASENAEADYSKTYLDPNSEFAKHIDISPEDLEEKYLTRFDFAEEIRQEMLDSDLLPKEDDRTLSLSGADYDARKDPYVATPSGVEDIPKDEGEDFIAHEHIIGDDAPDDELALEGAVGPEIPPEEMLEEMYGGDSSSSSSPINDVFDQVTGAFVPWEIQHQFRRQFTDPYIEQEVDKKMTTKSVDMGVFYRRDTSKDAELSFKPDVSEQDKQKQSTSSDEPSPTTKKKIQRVRFSLSEDHDVINVEYAEEKTVNSYDLKLSEEWKKLGGDDSFKVLESSSFKETEKAEPHEKITEAYQQAVIATIIESRIQNEITRRKEMEEMESYAQSEPDVVPTTKVKITSADTVSYTSVAQSIRDQYEGEDVEVEEEEYDDDENYNVEMVNTMSQTTESQPLCVVSRESRLAQEELLKESFDEMDRSISPSIEREEHTTYQNECQDEFDLMLSRKFPVIVHSCDKSLDENEVYESSGTDRDTAEDERLSPIEETSGGETGDDNLGEAGDTKNDKKVTFQTDLHNLCSVSSEELVKTSTSSSEVEPTLLAASYDLDSGRVSHVVTSYDLSPDTVEKQFLPVAATSKSILSSPEDDVFEADLTSGTNDTVVTAGDNETPTEGDIELLPRDSESPDMLVRSASTGTGTFPSPPAPSPFEPFLKEDQTTTDLEGVAMKMQQLQSVDSIEKQNLHLRLLTRTSTQSKSSVDTDNQDEDLSPFEIMSPSELDGYEQYADKQREFEAMMALSATSQASTSSYAEVDISDVVDVPPIFHSVVIPSAPPMPDLLSPDKSTNDSSFEHSSPVSSEPSEKELESPFEIHFSEIISQVPDILSSVLPSHVQSPEDIRIPNGPTEVEFNPEIDLDFSGPSYQPPTEEQQEDETEQLEQQQQEDETEQQEQPQDEHQETSEQFVIVSQSTFQASIQQSGSQTAVTEDQMTGSVGMTGQTGYLTESIMEDLPVQSGQDLLIVSDGTLYGLDMPSDEAASMTASHFECDSLNVSAYTSTSLHDDTSEQVSSREVLGQIVGVDRTEEDLSERPSESIQDIPESPETVESRDTIEGETLAESFPLDAQTPSLDMPTIPLDIQIAPLDIQYFPLEEGAGENYKTNKDNIYPGKRALEVDLTTFLQCETEDFQDVEVSVERLTPDQFLDEEELDEELMKLREVSDYEIDNKLEDTEGEEREALGSAEEQADFELKADIYDVDRPLSPTPEAGSKDEQEAEEDFDFECENGSPKDEILQRTASEFVENVLEEVKVKSKYKAALDIEDDVALVQSPLSENGGDITDFADDLPYDEPSEFPDDHEEEAELLETKMADESKQKEDAVKMHDNTDLLSVDSASPIILVKQISEEIPEITLTQHLHEEINNYDIFEYTKPAAEDKNVDMKDKEQVDAKDIVSDTEYYARDVAAESVESSHTKSDQTFLDEVTVPEENDRKDLQVVEEQFTPLVSISVQSKILPSQKDHTDSGKVCVPEEADLDDIENEFTKTDSKQLSTPVSIDHLDSNLVDSDQEEPPRAIPVTSSVTTTTSEQSSVQHDFIDSGQSVSTSESTVIESSSTESSASRTSSTVTVMTVTSSSHSTEHTHFLGKRSDSDTFSAKFDSKSVFMEGKPIETEFVIKSAPEQELKSERLVDKETVIRSKTSESKEIFYDAETEVKSICFVEKLHSVSSAIPIPTFKKATRTDSLDSMESNESSQANAIDAKSSEFDDAGDSSSLDSFTTVVAADDEEEEGEDRLADFASLTSSIHSDIQGGAHTEEEDEKEETRDPLQELMAWAQEKKTKETFQSKEVEEEELESEDEKSTSMYPWNKQEGYEKTDEVKGILPFPWMKDQEEDSESLGGSDKYEYIDRQALSVITELSEEDRFEIIDKEDLESGSTGTGSDSRHYSSPDIPPPSPMSNLKFFSKSGEKDDISVSSSLLEFENLEYEINQSRSSGSLENAGKDSLGSSLDESKFLGKSSEKDDVSISSSLADFERLERELNQGSSNSSIEKILSPAVISPPEIGKSSSSSKSSVSGSVTSLSEFEKLERDCTDETRRSSMESFSRITSITSSQASLNEFERIEQDLVIAEQLELEAQKIVLILESGCLLPNQYYSEPELSYSESLATTREIFMKKGSKEEDIDKDSIDGRDEIEEDSLSDNKKKARGDVPDDTDSLDGDQSDMTTSITSAILKSESATRIGTDFDVDSLHDSTHSSDGAMKISSDSLGEKMGVSKPEKDKFDTDSLHEQEEGTMDKSADSLELNQEIISTSPEKFETDSLHEQEDAMQTSVDSLESYQIEPKHNVMEVSMDSVGTGWSSASSMFSRSSVDTMRSADHEDHSDSGQSRDVMEESMESWDEYEADEEETDNFYIISKYQSSMEAAKSSISTKTEKTGYTHPYLDFEGNVPADNYQFMMQGTGWNENFQNVESKSNTLYLAKQPYEEKKKIYTMTEWEAMKQTKKMEALQKEQAQKQKAEEGKQETKTVKGEKMEESTESIPEKNVEMEKTLTSTLESETDSGSVTKTTKISKSEIEKSRMFSSQTVHFTETVKLESASKEPPTSLTLKDGTRLAELREQQQQRLLSIDDDEGHSEYDPHEHAESLRHGIPDHFDDDVEGAEGGDTQTTRITMKKEIHTKTVLKDGQEQTFVHEDSHVEQDPNAPEELRDSMQQIIDEFMGSPTEAQKPLEHDV